MQLERIQFLSPHSASSPSNFASFARSPRAAAHSTQISGVFSCSRMYVSFRPTLYRCALTRCPLLLCVPVKASYIALIVHSLYHALQHAFLWICSHWVSHRCAQSVRLFFLACLPRMSPLRDIPSHGSLMMTPLLLCTWHSHLAELCSFCLIIHSFEYSCGLPLLPSQPSCTSLAVVNNLSCRYLSCVSLCTSVYTTDLCPHFRPHQKEQPKGPENPVNLRQLLDL